MQTIEKVLQIIKEYKTKVLDTRKTTPGMRLFEKYAVKFSFKSILDAPTLMKVLENSFLLKN